MRARSIAISLSVFASGLSAATADLVSLVNLGTDNRIATISGLAISGTANDGIYDFTFHHGISYDTLQTNMSPTSPITWATAADANVVLEAIRNAVNAFGDVSTSVIRTDDIFLPFMEIVAIQHDFINARVAQNNPTTNYGSWYTTVVDSGDFTQLTPLVADDTWVTASITAVPELQAPLCMCAALACVVIAERRSNPLRIS